MPESIQLLAHSPALGVALLMQNGCTAPQEPQSGRTATGDCQYVSRALGAEAPPLGADFIAHRLRAEELPLGAALVTQSGRTAHW